MEAGRTTAPRILDDLLQRYSELAGRASTIASRAEALADEFTGPPTLSMEAPVEKTAGRPTPTPKYDELHELGRQIGRYLDQIDVALSRL